MNNEVGTAKIPHTMRGFNTNLSHKIFPILQKGKGEKGEGEKGRERERKGEKGRERERKGEKGRERERKGEKGRERERKGEKGRERERKGEKGEEERGRGREGTWRKYSPPPRPSSPLYFSKHLLTIFPAKL